MKFTLSWLKEHLDTNANIDEICDRAKENPLLLAIASGNVVAIARKDFIEAIRDVHSSVDRAEILRYEQYAGITPEKVKTDKEEKPIVTPKTEVPVPPKTEQAPVVDNLPKAEARTADEIEFASEEIRLLPNKKVHLEFFVNNKYDNASIKLDGKNYACRKNIRNFISEDFEIEAGEYTVEIFGDGRKIGEKTVRVVKGMKENDFEL